MHDFNRCTAWPETNTKHAEGSVPRRLRVMGVANATARSVLQYVTPCHFEGEVLDGNGLWVRVWGAY